MHRFEWDDAKNVANLRKHGIGFDEAAEIFDGPVLTRVDERANGEMREISFGFVGSGIVVTVVHTDCGGVVRIISARKATGQERRFFRGYLEEALG